MTEQNPSASDQSKRPLEDHDVILWPDNTWCWAFEYPENAFKGKEYRVLPFGSEEWMTVTDQLPY